MFPNHRAIEYLCKFCGAKGALEIDTEVEWFFKLEKWLPLAACNRCADFSETLKMLEDAIKGIAHSVASLPNNDGKKNVPEGLRKSLVTTTRAYAMRVCNFYRRPIMWEPEFVQTIIEKPNMVVRFLSAYRGGIARDSKR